MVWSLDEVAEWLRRDCDPTGLWLGCPRVGSNPTLVDLGFCFFNIFKGRILRLMSKHVCVCLMSCRCVLLSFSFTSQNTVSAVPFSVLLCTQKQKVYTVTNDKYTDHMQVKVIYFSIVHNYADEYVQWTHVKSIGFDTFVIQTNDK